MVTNRGIDAQGMGVAALLLGSIASVSLSLMPPALAEPATPVVAPAMSNEERAIAFVDLIFAEQYDAALIHLHPLLRAGSATGLAERTAELEQQVGEFQAQQGTETVENVVLVNAQFADALDTIIIIFDENGLITGVDFPLEPEIL